MEWLNAGQHIEHCRIEAWDGKSWKTLVAGHGIGHKRIDGFPAVNAARLRLNILSSAAEPAIREFQLFRVGKRTIPRTAIIEVPSSARQPPSTGSGQAPEGVWAYVWRVDAN